MTTGSAQVAAAPVGDRVDQLIAEQEQAFLRRQTRSAELIEQARTVLAGGATSNWQIAQPQAVWLSHGEGSKIYDVDGTEYVDMHGGYGASIAGHAHPAIVAAVSDRVRRGTHFAQPTEDAIWVATELRRRFGLPLWRFANSGTEATMDAVHLMRAATGRDLIIKVEGCYHGHHDSVQVSVLPEPEEIGPREHPTGVPGNTGIPAAIRDLVVVVPFNDLDAVERVLAEHRGRIAGMILEPVMMNAGIIPPQPGYLAGLRELLHAEDALLTFDEVKTGFTTGPGGITARSGVTPDLVALAKAMGGGISVAALGGTAGGDVADRRRHLRAGRHVQRQPAGDGRGPGDPDRRPRRRRLRPARRAGRAAAHAARGRDRRRRHRLAGGHGRRQGLHHLHRAAGARVPRLPDHRRPARAGALAGPAQRRGVPAAVGQGGAVADLRAARGARRRPVRGQLRRARRACL